MESGSEQDKLRLLAAYCQGSWVLQEEPPLNRRRVADGNAALALLASIAGEPVEVGAFLYLDDRQHLLGMRHIRSAVRDELRLPVRVIVADALAFDAVGLIIAHNHPSGDPSPSLSDRDATRLMLRATDAIGVRLLDHLVLASGGVTSFRALGLL